ncbi:NAD(P)-binding protein [Phanerochaete sordida]|uniref:NAD(P)-binding protein n=1 Tax=Phanerochaete sordida TaxID=48140 RepID=A0A9P3LJE3_9APHY|nr:NAD(P)-binding protein [Phanerochaete sordida]
MDSPKVWLGKQTPYPPSVQDTERSLSSVTGSSSGFGLALCKLLLSKGDKVVATLRKPADLAGLSAQYDSNALLALELDVTHPEEITHTFATAKAHFGRVDVVFNNAGCAVVGEIEAVPEHDARALMDVDFWGAAAVSTAAVRFFREENPPGVGGLLLNVSSMFGHNAFACIGHYSAAKFALEGLTEALAQELDPEWNTKVCLVVPGLFRTEVRAKAATVPVPPAYASVNATSGARKYIDAAWDPSRPTRIGDTDKAVARIREVALLESPPSRLFLGTDCVTSVRAKIARVTAELDASQEWAEGLLEDV